MCLGANIRYLRIQKGFSQEYIAKKLGYKSFTTIQKWESGVSEPPIRKLKELADLLDADINELNSVLLENRNLSVAQSKNISQHTEKHPQSSSELIEISYGKTAKEAFDLYIQLDSDDQGEIRGEMKQMLKAVKYSIKESKHA